MRKLTKRYITTELNNLHLTSPIRYERYYINKELRIQKKENKYEKEILDEENNVIEKVNIDLEEFNALRQISYNKLIRDSYLYLDDPRVSIKKYLDEYEGLYRVELKFSSEDEMNSYIKEDWMGQEITNSPLAFDKDLSNLSKEEFTRELKKYIK